MSSESAARASGGAMTRRQIVEFLLERVASPGHHGRIEGADVVLAGGDPGCGDVVTVQLRVDG
jgi:nitrogen fixation NifU-like protein